MRRSARRHMQKNRLEQPIGGQCASCKDTPTNPPASKTRPERLIVVDHEFCGNPFFLVFAEANVLFEMFWKRFAAMTKP